MSANLLIDKSSKLNANTSSEEVYIEDDYEEETEIVLDIGDPLPTDNQAPLVDKSEEDNNAGSGSEYESDWDSFIGAFADAQSRRISPSLNHILGDENKNTEWFKESKMYSKSAEDHLGSGNSTRIVIKGLPPRLSKKKFCKLFPEFPVYYNLRIFPSEEEDGRKTSMAYLRVVDPEEAHYFREEYDGHSMTLEDDKRNNNSFQIQVNYLEVEDSKGRRGGSPAVSPASSYSSRDEAKRGYYGSGGEGSSVEVIQRRKARKSLPKKGEGERMNTKPSDHHHHHHQTKQDKLGNLFHRQHRRPTKPHYYGEEMTEENADEIKRVKKEITSKKLNKIFPIEVVVLMLMFANSLFAAYLFIIGLAGTGLIRSLHSILHFGHQRPPVDQITGIHLSAIGLLTAFGAFLLIIGSFVGGVGVITWDKRLLHFFIRVATGIALLQFVFAAIVFFFAECQSSIHEEALRERFNLYGQTEDNDSTEVIDRIQYYVHCCGFDGPETFSNTTPRIRTDKEVEVYPASCCTHEWSHNLYCSLGVSEGDKSFDKRISQMGCFKEMVKMCDMVIKLDGIGLIMWLFAYSVNISIIIIILVLILRTIHKIEKKAMARSKAEDRAMLKHEFEVHRKLVRLANLRERASTMDKRKIREYLREEGIRVSDSEMRQHEDIDDSQGEEDGEKGSDESDEGYVEPEDPLSRKHIIKLVDQKENAKELMEQRGLSRIVTQIRNAYKIDHILDMPKPEDEIKDDWHPSMNQGRFPLERTPSRINPGAHLYKQWPGMTDLDKAKAAQDRRKNALRPKAPPMKRRPSKVTPMSAREMEKMHREMRLRSAAEADSDRLMKAREERIRLAEKKHRLEEEARMRAEGKRKAAEENNEFMGQKKNRKDHEPAARRHSLA